MSRLAIHTGFANCYCLQNLHAPEAVYPLRAPASSPRTK